MVFAGIDVSKAHLDLALLGPELNRTLRFPNTEEGRKSLLAALLQHRPAWIALEPSSAYHLPLVTLLAQKGFRVALVNPYQVASFGRVRIYV
ncbi:IS110 family transposase [Thermus thermophilus]|nr:IS110 family transposase [Thermus thermophilus]